ncbi:MAG TPA: hypothetical protein VMR34_00100 [Candidatus Saccharimonadales bacterium]|nr:hypothetical protein [Candidatus Saccharimonadales bacterium]
MVGLISPEIRDVAVPIAGEPKGKNLLSMHQLNEDDIYIYLEEAQAASRLVDDPSLRGIRLLPHAVMKAVMRQPSTRTGGSMTTAMFKLGGAGELISGMSSSSEAKGESLADSWIAFATQADILGIRTAEDNGPAFAARVIAESAAAGKLPRTIPVINLGDGRNEHPTQALGDEFTIFRKFGRFEGLVLAVVGDHERYRAHHSLMIGAAMLGMTVVAVESKAAKVPPDLVAAMGNKLSRTYDLDEAMRYTDALYVGRKPDEYAGRKWQEKRRERRLDRDYRKWVIDNDRLQQMSPNALVLHPRPRRGELHPSVDSDPRMGDVMQMYNMIAMRMAIIALHLGESISEYVMC